MELPKLQYEVSQANQNPSMLQEPKTMPSGPCKERDKGLIYSRKADCRAVSSIVEQSTKHNPKFHRWNVCEFESTGILKMCCSLRFLKNKRAKQSSKSLLGENLRSMCLFLKGCSSQFCGNNKMHQNVSKPFFKKKKKIFFLVVTFK